MKSPNIACQSTGIGSWEHKYHCMSVSIASGVNSPELSYPQHSKAVQPKVGEAVVPSAPGTKIRINVWWILHSLISKAWPKFCSILTDQICIGKTETLNILSRNCTSTQASINEILICQKSVSAKVSKTMASQSERRYKGGRWKVW